jgi:uncharacterized membrane protein YheB (UPF0754 family)
MALDYFTSPEFIEILKYLSIPVVSGAIGWFTNKVAVIMTFEPIDFWGVKLGKIPLGWQGIIPANAPKMAGISVDLMTDKLINVEEIFNRLDPNDVAKEMAPNMQRIAERVVNEAMNNYAPRIWSNTPKTVKKAIFDRAAADMPEAISAMMIDIKENLSDLLDIKKMCVDAMLNDRRLVNEIFLKCGKEEFKFIEISGWWFGLVFGIFQMAAWYFYPADWTLPVCGIIVGYVTNWLALKLIFEPKRMIVVGPWKIVGLFIKRQMEVSEEYAKIVSAKILNSKNFWDHMLNDVGGERMMQLIENNISLSVDKSVSGIGASLAKRVVGIDKYEEIKRKVIVSLARELPNTMHDLNDFTDKAFDIETTLRVRLQALSPDEFEGILRPAFQEEELKLILVGAVLGGLAGLLQLIVVFGG